MVALAGAVLAAGGTLAVGLQASHARSAMAQDPPPRVTLLYQNFPNPFPTPESITTCVWFDLAIPAAVQLEVYDLRGHLVRSLLAGGQDAVFPAGRHGRPGIGTAGCDPRTEWDGRASNGRTVPPGVYLLRLRAGGTETIRKIVFRGF